MTIFFILAVLETDLKQGLQCAYPVDFIHIFVHEKSKLKDFLEYIVKVCLSNKSFEVSSD